jgi:hypothetical protein
VRVTRWWAFAATASDHDVTVIPDSALLQLPVFTMLRRNVDPSIIVALVSRLAEAAAPLRPSLVYLGRRDPEVAFRAIAERRGLAWLLQHAASSSGYAFTQARGLSGLEGLLAYWRAHAVLCGAIVERVDIPKLVVEVGSDGWIERRRQICDFVDVPFEDDPVADATTIATVTGRYSDGKREVTVETVEGRLVLRGILWASNVLLPVARNVFDLESWPLRLSFAGDTAETIDTFRCKRAAALVGRSIRSLQADPGRAGRQPVANDFRLTASCVGSRRAPAAPCGYRPSGPQKLQDAAMSAFIEKRSACRDRRLSCLPGGSETRV